MTSFKFTGKGQALANKFLLRPTEEMLRDTMLYVRNNRIEGDYFEFGVGQGSHLCATYNFAPKDMHFHGFDSFQGLPEAKGIDAIGFKNFKKGEFCYSLKEIDGVFKKAQVDRKRITLYPGWFSETLPKLSLKTKASIVIFDADIYESTKTALDWILPYLQDGTVLLFTDWYNYRGRPDKGEHKAFTDWVKENNVQYSHYRQFSWNGESFIIHKEEISEDYKNQLAI